jgi:hypothetical protein
MSKTTILIESETRNLLKQVGRKEQSYDELENLWERMKNMIKVEICLAMELRAPLPDESPWTSILELMLPHERPKNISISAR